MTVRIERKIVGYKVGSNEEAAAAPDEVVASEELPRTWIIFSGLLR